MRDAGCVRLRSGLGSEADQPRGRHRYGCDRSGSSSAGRTVSAGASTIARIVLACETVPFRLPCRDESLIKRFDHRIATRGYERGHVEHCTDWRTATSHEPSPAEGARIATLWRDASEFSNLLAGQATEFWEIGDQRAREHRARVRCAAHQCILRGLQRRPAIAASSSVSAHVSSRSRNAMCAVKLFFTGFLPRPKTWPKRLRSAPSISSSCSRRVNSASSSCASAVGNTRTAGRTVSAKRARISASMRSVFASCTVARAKSRNCRGYTLPHVPTEPVRRPTVPPRCVWRVGCRSRGGRSGSGIRRSCGTVRIGAVAAERH